MKYHEIPMKYMKYHEIPMKYHEIPMKYMKYHEIPMKSLLHEISAIRAIEWWYLSNNLWGYDGDMTSISS